MSITFTDWASSVAGCGAFTYTSTYNDNSALNSDYITFNAVSKSYSVSTSNNAYLGTYTIKVVGTLASGATATTTI